LALLISCNKLEVDLHKRLISTIYVKKLNKFNWGLSIEKPENTKFSLLEIKRLKKNSFNYEYECIFIKTAYKESLGHLYIAKKVKAECKKQLHKEMVDILSFKKISIALLEKALVIRTDGKLQKIKLPNLSLNKSQFMKYYSSNLKTSFLENGVNEKPMMLPPVKSIEEKSLFKSQINKKVSKITPFTILNKKCHSLDGKCRSKKEYTCDSCSFGYIEVVGGLCERGGDKYCAPKSCGGLGEPACYRGKIHTTGPKKLACQNESVEGICNFGLKTYCSEGVLFCR
jgi:hypothetical protein